MSRAYDSTKYLVQKSYFRIKFIWEEIKGKTWVMYKNINKDKKSIEQYIYVHMVYQYLIS